MHHRPQKPVKEFEFRPRLEGTPECSRRNLCWNLANLVLGSFSSSYRCSWALPYQKDKGSCRVGSSLTRELLCESLGPVGPSPTSLRVPFAGGQGATTMLGSCEGWPGTEQVFLQVAPRAAGVHVSACV